MLTRYSIVTLTNDATHQFQCDLGKTPTYGFSIATNGSVLYMDSDQFFACPATDTEYNVYTQWLKDQEKCQPVTLSTNGTCVGGGFSAPSGTACAITTYAPIGSTASEVSPLSQQTTPAIYSSYNAATVPVYSHGSSGSQSTTVIISTVSASSGSAALSETALPMTSYTPSSETAHVSSPLSASTPSIPPNQQTTLVVYSSQNTAAVPTYSYSPQSSERTTAIISTVSARSSIESSAMETRASQSRIYSYSTVSVTMQATRASMAPESSVPVGKSSTPSSTETTTLSSYSETTRTSTTTATTASSFTPPSGTWGNSTTGTACQTSLTGAYQTPHLIIPITSKSPNTPEGTSYNATINSEYSTIFNFDIPSSYAGKTCSVIFLFPEQKDLETSAYTFSGSGDLVFYELSGVANEQTTYNNAPAKNETLNTIAIQSGNSYVVSTGMCAGDTTESIELSSQNGLSLEFFEDWNPSSLGLYITSC